MAKGVVRVSPFKRAKNVAGSIFGKFGCVTAKQDTL